MRPAMTALAPGIAVLLALAAYGCGQDPAATAPPRLGATMTPAPTEPPVIASAAPAATPTPSTRAMPAATQTSHPTPVSTVTPARGATAQTSHPTPVSAVTPARGAAQDRPRDVGRFGLFPGPGSAAYGGGDSPRVEDVLEKGLYAVGITPVHIAFLGTADAGSVRCDWRGEAMTREQRDSSIRFWLGLGDDAPLPSASDAEAQFLYHIDQMSPIYRDAQRARFLSIARGGLSNEHVFLACYVDYAASEYVLGAGPKKLTVAYDSLSETVSYDVYKRSHEAGRFGHQPLMSKAEYDVWIDTRVEAVEELLRSTLEGQEGVVFLAPMGAHHAIAVEAWQAVAQWDVQRSGTSTVTAVRYGAHQGDPEHTQTLDMLKARIASSSAATTTPSGGASGSSSTSTPQRVATVGGLTAYYKSIGAYGFIGPYTTTSTGASGASGQSASSTGPSFTPAQPPPVYAPRPSGLTATTTAGASQDSASLAWSAVSGASGYHVQHRVSGGAGPWTSASRTVSGTSHTVSGLWCGKTHDFRVGAYGDGTTRNARAGLWSETATTTMAACAPQKPRFATSSYAFEVSAAAATGTAVGVASAFDVNGDVVSYSLSGAGAAKFSVNASGTIAVASSLTADVGKSHTLTVGASDGVSGTATVTATVAVRAPTCSDGTAVARPRFNYWLVSDCKALLDMKGALAGTSTLGWSAYAPITGWTGVTVTSTPRRVTGLSLSGQGLNGTVPPEIWKLSRLRTLDLSSNRLTGAIPRELEYLTDLSSLRLGGNLLTGCAPSALRAASSTDVGAPGLAYCAPRFASSTYAFSVNEDAAVNSVVGRVSATDPDPQDTVTYTITAGNAEGAFALGTGTTSTPITVAAALDYETTKSYTLTLQASDGNGGVGTTTVSITVTDVVDTLPPPAAPAGLTASASGGTAVGLSWSSVTGADRYRVERRGASGTIWTTEDANVTSTAYTVSGLTCGTAYDFRVGAQGDGRTHSGWSASYATTTATTAVCGNSPPRFATSTYSFSVSENAATSTVVGTVSATDPDANDTLSFSITAGNAAGKFAIGSGTTSTPIKVAVVLDYETTKSYTLTLQVSDGKGGTATTTVSITVTDVADTPPDAPSGLTASVSGGTVVDLTWNAVAGADRYRVDRRGASTTTWTAVTSSATSTAYTVPGLTCATAYDFRVGAHGDGKTRLGWSASYTTTTATTAACSNNAPRFASSTYSFSVAENASTNTVVGRVSATDPDASDTLSYSITAGNDAGKFALGTGTTSTPITVAAALDYETTQSYTLTLQASDSNGGTATTSVSITVTDVADTLPPAPSSLTASVLGTAVMLSWKAPDDPTVTGYRIIRETNVVGIGPSSVHVIDTGSTATTYIDVNVSPGTSYSYAVMAINAAGVGPRTPFVTVTVPGQGRNR